jgi:hypothetical protein
LHQSYHPQSAFLPACLLLPARCGSTAPSCYSLPTATLL